MLSVAPGFETNLLQTISLNTTSDAPPLTHDDCTQILAGQAGRWALSVNLSLEEYLLTPPAVSPLLLEFLTAQAVLAFRVPASEVKPVAAVGRIILIDYTPWKRLDPPVPLLSLIPLPQPAVLAYEQAIHTFLLRDRADLIGPAIRKVLKAGTGLFNQAEAFYFYLKMLSLVTGAYTQKVSEGR